MRRPEWLGHPLALVAAGAVALAAGAAIAVAAFVILDPSPAGGSPVSAASPFPGHGVPGNGGSLGALPPRGGAGGRRALQLMVAGRVTAVSSTSITLAGQGHSITAALTRGTRITGRSDRAAGIKVGDTVSAQISETGSPAVLALQDPASVP